MGLHRDALKAFHKGKLVVMRRGTKADV
jgi:hypothetical protein